MSGRIRHHIRDNVIGYLAPFVALGIAPAWAASLRPNSVGTKQLKRNAVTAVKIRNGQVTSPDLATGAVTSAKDTGGR